MALHFVSTSVLSAKDNGEYSEEMRENEEVLLAKVAASKSANKPLYEQLAEQAMKKQAEYDANTKLIFGRPLLPSLPPSPLISIPSLSSRPSSAAPPRALQEEDWKYYESLSEIKQKEISSRQENENKEIQLFKQAQHRQDNEAEHPSIAFFQPKHEDHKRAATTPKIGTRGSPFLFFFCWDAGGVVVAYRRSGVGETAPSSPHLSILRRSAALIPRPSLRKWIRTQLRGILLLTRAMSLHHLLPLLLPRPPLLFHPTLSPLFWDNMILMRRAPDEIAGPSPRLPPSVE